MRFGVRERCEYQRRRQSCLSGGLGTWMYQHKVALCMFSKVTEPVCTEDDKSQLTNLSHGKEMEGKRIEPKQGEALYKMMEDTKQRVDSNCVCVCVCV